jgi:hypothetical protein
MPVVVHFAVGSTLPWNGKTWTIKTLTKTHAILTCDHLESQIELKELEKLHDAERKANRELANKETEKVVTT